MMLQLEFKNLQSDLTHALATVRINDASEYDAPANILSELISAPFEVLAEEPIISLDVGLNIPAVSHELSISATVECKNTDGVPLKFINTSLTSLAVEDDGTVPVILEKV